MSQGPEVRTTDCDLLNPENSERTGVGVGHIRIVSVHSTASTMRTIAEHEQ